MWTAGRFLVLAMALGATYGVFFLTSMRIATRAREVTVPDVRGRSVTEAGDLLERAGLAIRLDPVRRADRQVPADHVLSQDPEPGAVIRRQRGVRVRVSDGPRDPVVPAVTGQPERTAEATLAQAQVSVASRAEIRTTAYPAGSVVAQDPPASARAGGVALLLNRGEGTAGYVMPDVIGTPGGRVADVLRGLGFRVTIVAAAPYPGLAPGVVIRQSPAAGFQVSFGEAISLEVSR